MDIDATYDLPGNVLGPVPLNDAVRRVLAYCTEPASGWGPYDLVGIHARAARCFDHIWVWSLLLANALNGQVSLDNLARFTPDNRERLATRLASISPSADLGAMWKAGHIAGIGAVVEACRFGFTGVWGPKTTKLAALYRPAAIPVLDGHVAMAFGFTDDGFSKAAWDSSGLDRHGRIEKVVNRLAEVLVNQRSALRSLRNEVEPKVPEIRYIPDLRLIDIVIWTSQDDRMERRERQGPRWIDRPIGERLRLSDFGPTPI